jgi:predicted acylesterase/phospholipase RssA
LALSGGGFRAAFFHVGVLSRLAELDLLRHVRTLSCVSGGSIAGAIYYLTVLSVLAERDVVDAEFRGSLRPEPLTPAEVDECVRRTHAYLLRAARANIRALVFKNPAKNLFMFLSTAYSRTDRAGDMLDRHLYRRILHTRPRLWRAHRQLELRHLHVERDDVPRLVLNATTLNSGHAWRFRTDGMGEQLVEERQRLDRNDVFAFAPYGQLPAHQANFPLGAAVAASACFPGLFRPLPVTALYPDTRIDLMDGGAQDNQGIQAILDEHDRRPFQRVIVSDGAGQLEDERVQGRRLLSVIGRVIGVQGDRIREEQLLGAEHRLAEEGTTFDLVDLRQGIVRRVLQPIGMPSDPERPPRDVRESIAAIRTDLDAFAPLEARLLVARGFRVASSLGGSANDDCPLLEPAARAELEEPSDRTFKLLKRSRRWFFKPVLYWLAVAVVAVPLLALAGYGLYRAGPGGWDEVGMWALLAAFAVLPAVVSRALFRWVTWHSGWIRWLAIAGLYVTLFLLAWVFGVYIDSWVGMSWSHAEVSLLALGLLVLPALAPCLLWFLLAPEGRAWRRIAR